MKYRDDLAPRRPPAIHREPIYASALVPAKLRASLT
jgi:hypothetical protein